MMGANFAPINTSRAPKQNMPSPRLKKAQLLFGSLIKRLNQLILMSFADVSLVIRVLAGLMFGSVFYCR